MSIGLSLNDKHLQSVKIYVSNKYDEKREVFKSNVSDTRMVVNNK
jgi:hypothetical protein